MIRRGEDPPTHRINIVIANPHLRWAFPMAMELIDARCAEAGAADARFRDLPQQFVRDLGALAPAGTRIGVAGGETAPIAFLTQWAALCRG